MTANGQSAKASALPEWLVFLVPAALLLALPVALQGLSGWPALNDHWVGPDSYMRVVRVLELVNGATWWEPVSTRANFPAGEVLHWSRAFDLWILALSIPFLPFCDIATAIKIAAQIASPLLRLGVLLALLWAVRPYTSQSARLAIGVVFAMQFSILTYLAVGRPDHHGLILLTWTVALGLLCRLLYRNWRARDVGALGLVLGLAVWTSIEGLFTAGTVFLSLGLLWLIFDEARARQLLVLSAIVSLTIAGAIALEFHPVHWLLPVYDKISFPHLALFIVIAMLWGLMAFLPPPQFAGRLAFCAIAGVVLIVFAITVYPKLLAGPMVDIEPRVVAEWYAQNAEVEGLMTASGFKFGDPKAIVYGLQLLIILAYFLHRGRAGGNAEGRHWALLALLSLITAVMVVFELRWSIYFELLAAIGMGLVLAAAVQKVGAWPMAARTLSRIAIILCLMLGPQLLGLVAATTNPRTATTGECNMRDMAAYLNNAYDARAQSILASNFAGPELLYRTDHNVVATPYHRNSAGILDSIDVLDNADASLSQAIVERRQIDLILLCPPRDRDAAGLSTDTPIPSWLQEVALPPDFGYRLFEVIR